MYGLCDGECCLSIKRDLCLIFADLVKPGFLSGKSRSSTLEMLSSPSLSKLKMSFIALRFSWLVFSSGSFAGFRAEMVFCNQNINQSSLKQWGKKKKLLNYLTSDHLIEQKV